MRKGLSPIPLGSVGEFRLFGLTLEEKKERLIPWEQVRQELEGKEQE